MVMKKLFALGLILCMLPGIGSAQETIFGKNKVRYKSFEWSFIQTRHFDIYFYEDAYPTAKFTATTMESAYVEISKELNYKIQKRIPVFLYNSHNDFQQTNITFGSLPEGVGGFTEIFKNRIVIPHNGSYEDLRHVLHHELTHAIVNDLVFGGNSFSSLISRQRFFSVPLWYAEGYAEYSSRHGWDYWSDMFVRDATINGYLAPPRSMGGFLAYKEGQAFIKYIADTYGEDKIGEILQRGRVLLSLEKAVKSATGDSLDKIWKNFSREMKRRYWPEIAERKEIEEIAKQLTRSRMDGSFFNEKPVFSPDGETIAIFTDKSDYTEIVLISAKNGKKIASLVKGQRSGDLESLHSYVTGATFSPDGASIVFAAKSKGKEALVFVNVAKRKVYKKARLDFYNIVSPSWSPDGKLIAFSALEGHKRDLFIYNIETEQILKLTHDRYDDIELSWRPDSKGMVFSSDRPHPQNPVLDNIGHPYVGSEGAFMPGDFEYGLYNLFSIDIDSRRVEPVDVGPGQNKKPRVSPDGRSVAFLSNRNGIDNVYIGYLDSVKYYAITDILTGIFGLNWAPEGDRLVLSAFHKGAFDIFIKENLTPAGDNGVLTPTGYVLGKYDNYKRTVVDTTKSSPDDDDTDSTITVAEATTDPEQNEADSSQASDNDALASVDDDSGVDSDKKGTLAISPVDSKTSSEVETTDSTGSKGGEGELAISPDDTTTSSADKADNANDDEKAEDPDSDNEENGDIKDESGLYDDEYVYVSNDTTDILDSLMEIVPYDKEFRRSVPIEEPASFDSIPPLLPSGEYKISPYKVRFSPDFVSGGFAYDTFFGVRGQTVFLFSDYLGNHQIFVGTDLVNTIDQSNVNAFYFYNKNRTNIGFGLFHSKRFYIDAVNFLFSDRFYGATASAQRPFSTFSRLEFTLSQIFIDRKYLDIQDTRPDRNSKVTTGQFSYVFDNVLWGRTGPVNGKRIKATLEFGTNLFDSQDIEFYAFEFDYRKYWHFNKTFSLAFRVSGGGSEGSTPKQYFLGGTTNWIGNRRVDQTVYEVENLYFSDVVTPLRGVPYYELSGDRYGLVNMEFRFPLIQYFAMRFPLPLVLSNITGAVFTDIGAAWFGNNFKGGTSEGGRNRLQDIKTGFGVGMRMNLFGFALMRYDLAWSTDFDAVSAHPTSYFSFGADF